MAKPNTKTGSLRVHAGFTFMELMIVMVIIAMLVAIAVPAYTKHVQRAKEISLQGNLWAMRRAIDSFTADKEKPPQSLEDLVQSGYLKSLPKDPLCNDCEWSVVTTQGLEPSQSGVDNVKSSAPGIDSNGKAYSEY